MDLHDLTIETAKPLEGTTFQVTLPDGRTTALTLDEVVPFERPSRRRSRTRPGVTPLRDPFSLYFRGDPSILLPQGMYTFRSDKETIENVFIVPMAQDDQATEYEAIFA